MLWQGSRRRRGDICALLGVSVPAAALGRAPPFPGHWCRGLMAIFTHLPLSIFYILYSIFTHLLPLSRAVLADQRTYPGERGDSGSKNCRGLLEAETAGAEPLDCVSKVSSNTTGLPTSLGLSFAVYKSQLKQPPRSPALCPDLGWDEPKFCSAQCCSY